MSWLDSIMGGGDSGGFTDYGSLFGGGETGADGGGFSSDWFSSDTWGDSGGTNWWDSLGGGDDGGSGGGWGGMISGLFGGGGSGSGSPGGGAMGSIFSALLGGIGGSADAKMTEKLLQIKGKEERKNTAFEAQLVDYYKSTDNYKNFKSLDQYGQMSKVSQFAPTFNRTYTGPADPGAAPSP